MVQLVSAVARYTPQRIATALKQVIPELLKLSAKDDPEVREGVLQALETIAYKCPTELSPFLNPSLALGTQLIKYDPVWPYH